MNGQNEKQCIMCDEIKSLTKFYRSNDYDDGFKRECMSCTRSNKDIKDSIEPSTKQEEENKPSSVENIKRMKTSGINLIYFGPKRGKK